jgi:hypothetical protein
MASFACRRPAAGAGPGSRGRVGGAADEKGEEPEEVEQESDHEPRSSPYLSRQIKHLAVGRSIGEGQERLSEDLVASASFNHG